MIAAQYEITLPADYDMDIIRRRVAARGHALDKRPGIGLKAYLIHEIADGSTANAYAPFYLWTDPDALAAFHWGGQGFNGIVRDFGRPAVQTWIGGHFHSGPRYNQTPVYATKTILVPALAGDPQSEATKLQELAESIAENDDTHSVAWAIDPTTWHGIIFRLSTSRPQNSANATVYQVLHLSTPEMDQLR
ncbi:DUF4865 family protein [Arthrobacter sp. TMN-49]